MAKRKITIEAEEEILSLATAVLAEYVQTRNEEQEWAKSILSRQLIGPQHAEAQGVIKHRSQQADGLAQLVVQLVNERIKASQ